MQTSASRPRQSVPRTLCSEALSALSSVRRAVRGPGRERDLVVQSLKAAGAALLAWAVAREWLDDPMALMAPWVALVLVQATVYSSLRQAAQLFTAICAGALLASGAQVLTGDTFGAMALSLPVLMLLGNWPRFGDQGIYAATTALFTLAAAGPVTAPEVGHRLGQAALGAVIGVAVNALVLPPVHLRDVREKLVDLAHTAGDLLQGVADGLRRPDWDASAAAHWSQAATGLERQVDGLRSARRWSDESLRLTGGRLRILPRALSGAPPAAEDERWARITAHVGALTHTLAVAADETRTPGSPDHTTLQSYARLLQLIGNACHAEGRRMERGDHADSPGRDDRDAMEDLHAELQSRLRTQTAHAAGPTAVLGTLLLQAENIWAETVRTHWREPW